MTSKTVGTETTSFSYWPNGLLKRVILPDDSWTERTYTAAHWLSRITDQSGNYVQYTLDARGNPKEKRYRNASNTSWYLQTRVYDAYSRLVQEKSTTKPNGITEYDYGTDGNLDTVSAPLGRGLDYGYDELDRVASLVSPISGSSLTSIYYDLADRVTAVLDPNGSATDYEYDGFGALTQLTSPDTGTTYYTYASTSGRLESSTDARDITTDYTFDSMGRPTFLSWPDPGQNVQFLYDEASGVHGINQLTSTKVNSSSDLAFTYDANGRVVSRSQQVGGLSRLAQYEITNGRLTSITTPSNQVLSYTYSNGGRPTSVDVNGTPILTGILHYPYGPLMSWNWYNGLTEMRFRNADGLPTGVTGTAGIGTALGYDDALRIQTQTVAGLPAASWGYGYDLKDQLTTATPGSGQPLGWAYDLNGNRSSQSGAAPASYNYTSSSNRLSTLDGVSIITDPAGNITNGGAGVTFTYGPRNRMTSSTNAQGTTTYSYNALGERVKKSGPDGTVIFAYDEEGHLIGEYTSTGAMIQEIVWLEGIPVASLRPAAGGGIEIFNISADHLGTPRIIRRATDGVVVWRWDSDPFGVASPNENPSGAGTFKFNLRFPGQYADAETGLNYNYFRDYNPKTGRYAQSDPIGLEGGLNTYSYTASSPVSFIDPTGEFFLAPMAFGLGLGAITDIGVQLAMNNGNFKCVDWTQVGISAALGSVGGGLGSVTRLKRVGTEFSHWVPDRYLRPLSRSGKSINPDYIPALDVPVLREFLNSSLNGNYVSPLFHALTDPKRNLKGMTAGAGKLHPLFQQLLRAPAWLDGAVAGSSVGAANSAVNKLDCLCNK